MLGRSCIERARSRVQPGFSSFVAAGEQTIFPRKCNGPHGALDAVVVKLNASVFEKPFQPVPVIERVTDRLGGRTASRQFSDLRLEPDTQVRDQRFALRLTQG